jgi:hypothetical protein
MIAILATWIDQKTHCHTLQAACRLCRFVWCIGGWEVQASVALVLPFSHTSWVLELSTFMPVLHWCCLFHIPVGYWSWVLSCQCCTGVAFFTYQLGTGVEYVHASVALVLPFSHTSWVLELSTFIPAWYWYWININFHFGQVVVLD